MSLMDPDLLAFQAGFPRVSGDEPLAAKYSRSSGVFSPRERG